MNILIEVRGKEFKILEEIVRVPQRQVGWRSIHYKKQRYHLFGGIRNSHFIDLSNPIKGREQK